MEAFDKIIAGLVDSVVQEGEEEGTATAAGAEPSFEDVFRSVIQNIDVSFSLSITGNKQSMSGRCAACLAAKRPVKRNGKLWTVAVWMTNVELRDRLNGTVIASKPEHLFAEQRSCCGYCAKHYVEDEIKPLFVSHFHMDPEKFVNHPDWES